MVLTFPWSSLTRLLWLPVFVLLLLNMAAALAPGAVIDSDGADVVLR